MSLMQFCKHNMVTIAGDETVQEAAKLMKENDVGCVVVVESKHANGAACGKPIGIITDRDIAINGVANSSDCTAVKVQEVMCANPITIDHKADLSEAIEVLQEQGVRRAPVLDESENLCGIVTLDDMLVEMANNFSSLCNVIKKQIHVAV